MIFSPDFFVVMVWKVEKEEKVLNTKTKITQRMICGVFPSALTRYGKDLKRHETPKKNTMKQHRHMQDTLNTKYTKMFDD